MKRKYTVLLLCPDYMTNGWQEIFLYHVTAPDPGAAKKNAQEYAAEYNDMEIDEAKSFSPLAVFAGHLVDLGVG